MTRVEIIELNANLALLGRTRRRIPFLYTPGGPDGAPLVLTAPDRIPANVTLQVMRASTDKRILRGHVSRQPNGLVAFELSADVSQAQAQQFVADLTTGLGGQIEALTRAVVQRSA
ncbi:MAG: hypothetical protein AAFV53_22375 [Myxococcota bacterium]